MTEPVAIDEQIDAQKEIIAIHKNMGLHEAEIEMDEAILSSLIRFQSIESALTAERERAEKAEAALARVLGAISSDFYALSFQTMKQYRGALLSIAADKGADHE